MFYPVWPDAMQSAP